MDTGSLQEINLSLMEDQLYNQLPLVERFLLRQRAAQGLAQDGSPNAVGILAKAIARSDSRQVLAIALHKLPTGCGFFSLGEFV